VTEQSASGMMGDIGDRRLNAEIGAGEHRAHHGRPTSWAAVTIIVIGFIVGGIALPIGPNWVLFWVGVAIVVVGAIFGAATRIMDDWY
jgi:hypothetical protein